MCRKRFSSGENASVLFVPLAAPPSLAMFQNAHPRNRSDGGALAYAIPASSGQTNADLPEPSLGSARSPLGSAYKYNTALVR